MHVLLTRPYAKSLETKRQLEEIGCRVSIEPVLDILAHSIPKCEKRVIPRLIGRKFIA
jgi:hypothetical protein